MFANFERSHRYCITDILYVHLHTPHHFLLAKGNLQELFLSMKVSLRACTGPASWARSSTFLKFGILIFMLFVGKKFMDLSHVERFGDIDTSSVKSSQSLYERMQAVEENMKVLQKR